MAKRKRTSTTLSGAALLDEALLRYKSLLSPQEYARLLDELKQPLYSAIRFNTLKVDPAQALEYYLQTYGWQLKAVPYSRSGWWVMDSGNVSIGHTIEHRLGDYYIQDAASMLPVELFDTFLRKH